MGRPKGSKNRPKDSPAPKKPRAKKAAKAEVPAQPSIASEASGSHEFKKPNRDQVVKLMKFIVSMGNESQLLKESITEKKAKAVETQHFNKPALAIAERLYKMAKKNPEDFSIMFSHLLSYCDDLELSKIADENRGFDFKDNEDEIESATGEESASGRFRVIPKDDEGQEAA